MINVMIIEDDPMGREINSKFLKKLEGFTLVKAASNLEETKEFILNNNVDLVLLDVFLTKENGIDFLKWLRTEEFTIDTIMITADNAMESVQQAFRFGAVDYLIKPFSFERFRKALYQFKERLTRQSKACVRWGLAYDTRWFADYIGKLTVKCRLGIYSPSDG